MRNRGLAADGRLKSGLKLIGAKTNQTKISGRMRMYACEPEGIDAYVEPFLGSGAVVCGKSKHFAEVVGDVNEYVINFFKCMQQQPEQLWLALMEGVHQMELEEAEFFQYIRRSPPTCSEHPLWSGPPGSLNLAWASWYYLVNKYSFNGIVRFNEAGECNSTYCTTTKGRGIYDRQWYDAVRERLRDVIFLNEDYSSLLNYANGAYLAWEAPQLNPVSTWVVLDPPYYEVFTKYNRIAFTPEDHVRLRDRLAVGNYRWLLTINDRPEVRELYSDFNLLEHEIFYSCSQTSAGRGNNKELLVTNYDVDISKFEGLLGCSPKLQISGFPVLEPCSNFTIGSSPNMED